VNKQNRVETASHIVFILACLAIGYAALSRPTAPQTPARVGFADGRVVESSLLRPTVGSRTLFVGVQSTCSYCTRSMPFYRTLVSRAKQGPVKVIVGSREPTETTRRYLQEHDIHPDA
jgi:hypothetical protein